MRTPSRAALLRACMVVSMSVLISGCFGVRTDSRGPLMAEAVASTRPLVVRDAVGGLVYETAALVRALERSGRPVRIERDCLSACSMLLALERLCYTADARFGFHAATANGSIDGPSQTMLLQHYPAGVRDWFASSGAARLTYGFRYLTGSELALLDNRARLCEPG